MKDHEANIQLAICQIDTKIADLHRERARLMERLDYWKSHGEVHSHVFDQESKPKITCHASTSSSDVAVKEVIEW